MASDPAAPRPGRFISWTAEPFWADSSGQSESAEEAAHLDEEDGAALLTMQRMACDDTGRAVEHRAHLYRASRYAFDFRLFVRS